MTVEKSTKLKLNGLIYAQLGLIISFIVTAIVFYGGQVEKNKQFETFQTKQEVINANIRATVTDNKVLNAASATKEFVIRAVADESTERKVEDRLLRQSIKDNQDEIISLLKNKK